MVTESAESESAAAAMAANLPFPMIYGTPVMIADAAARWRDEGVDELLVPTTRCRPHRHASTPMRHLRKPFHRWPESTESRVTCQHRWPDPRPPWSPHPSPLHARSPFARSAAELSPRAGCPDSGMIGSRQRYVTVLAVPRSRCFGPVQRSPTTTLTVGSNERST
jgi:hypothetical protein